MIIIKNKKNIEKMKRAGKLLAHIMDEVKQHVVSSNNTLNIDDFIEKRIRQEGLRPECKGYAGYKHATCISINDVIVSDIKKESEYPVKYTERSKSLSSVYLPVMPNFQNDQSLSSLSDR